MANLVLLNNFMHDFSAAGWLAGTIVLWLMQRPPTERALTFPDVLRAMRGFMAFALFGIVVFGAVRAAAYKTYEWNPAAGDAQVTLLIVKHIVFTVLFVPGVVVTVRAGRLLRGIRREPSA